MKPEEGQVLTRIYILDSGDVLITDLWEEIQGLMAEEKGEAYEPDSDL